jgi:hypothetical protein
VLCDRLRPVHFMPPWMDTEVPEDSVTPWFPRVVSCLLYAGKVQFGGLDANAGLRDPRLRQVRLATRELEIGAVPSWSSWANQLSL